MSLILYILLAVLAVVTLVLLLPFLSPLRSAFLPLTSSLLTVPSYLVLALSVALLLSSYIEHTKYRALSSSTTASSTDYHAHFSRQVEAERDCILAATCIVLVLVCGRLAAMWKDVALLQAKYTAMERQAKGAAAAAISGLSTASLPTAATHSAELSELKAERDKWRQQLGAMEKQLQAMEKQARSANEAFLASDGRGKEDALQQVQRLKAEVKALKDDNDRLKTQVEDYDLVMGDTKKKKM